VAAAWPTFTAQASLAVTHEQRAFIPRFAPRSSSGDRKRGKFVTATLPVVVTRRWWLWLLLAVLIVIADQVSKAWILSWLRPGEERALTGFFSLVLAFNAGAAFSFLGGAAGWQRYVFGAVAVAASALIVFLLRRGGGRLYCAALSLILGGALGNLWDRVTLGRVVDFLLFHNFLPAGLPGAALVDPFPAFNIADSAISVGAALLLVDSFRRQPERRATAR
jgi:signal peptidase II